VTEDAAAPRRAQPSVPWWVVGGLLVLLAVPLALSLAALRQPTWHPVLDHAMAELRVRDVGGPDTPLVGLPGRIGTLERQGSHPGPLSFYLLAPVYRLLGSSAWSLQAAAASSALVAAGVALALARRSGGLRAVVGVTALLAVLNAGYGPSLLTEPWNPYLPLPWWVVFLLAAWAITGGRWWALPVAVFAGSVCAQTHLPYLGLVGVLGAGAVVAGALATRRDRRPTGARPTTPVLVALVLGVVLWSPVLVQQITGDPGNLSLLRAHMLDPPEGPVGVATGIRVVLQHLDPTALPASVEGASGSLVDPAHRATGSTLVGGLVLLAWATTAVVAWRHRLSAAVRMHAVVAGGLALGAFSVARAFGTLWYYLTLWAWALGAVAIATAAWTALLVLEHGRPPAEAHRLRRGSTVVLGGLVVVGAVALSAQVGGLRPPDPAMSAALGGVVEPTADALADGVGAASGRDGRYVVTWSDPVHIGSPGYGLVSELERRGFDVGGMPWAAAPLTAHRTIDPAEATALVHLATGTAIEDWRGRADAVEVASSDHRSPAARAEFAALRAEVLAALEAAGRDDVVPLVDGNLFGAALDPDLDASTRRDLSRMLGIGVPYAVYVVPSDSEGR
jgi:hypothetical protein